MTMVSDQKKKKNETEVQHETFQDVILNQEDEDTST